MNLAGVSGLSVVPVDVPKPVIEVDRRATLVNAAIAQGQAKDLAESLLPQGSEAVRRPSAAHSTSPSHIANCPDCLATYYRSGTLPRGGNKGRLNLSA